MAEDLSGEPAQPAEVLTKEGLVERFRKMVIGVSNGPLPSGDGAAIESLTLGDLKLVKQAVATLNLKTNAFVSRRKRQCAGRGAPPPQSAMRSREAWSPRAVSGALTVLRSTPERSLRPPRGPHWGMTATTLCLSDYVNGNFLTGQQLPSTQQRACRWARMCPRVCAHVRMCGGCMRGSVSPRVSGEPMCALPTLYMLGQCLSA